MDNVTGNRPSGISRNVRIHFNALCAKTVDGSLMRKALVVYTSARFRK
jgi:hypothetical protein